ncbi:alanine--tRNA ligase [Kiritimatiellota bacterium B12222]|nr:alanine--tRNA ligase [Kiritimatiellota bacterium B12222]
MNSNEIRQSFLDFFASKDHQIVPSASLLPSSPNLLFTNAGMNPFVPYFLGDRDAPTPRIADTQKCIRAGGKHNDLDDVGYDTYHQTFFEMLGNWSFGDYFKQEAIAWAWELLTGVWGFPKDRLYASVYKPGEGDPADFDQDAYDIWEKLFIKEGLDPKERIVFGNKKDNFWMMGDTGPCGPCSEIHIDLTPEGKDGAKLVNMDSPWCIEIWNLVFMQYNAGEDGSFKELAAQHVDTGMGFERVAGIMATTQNFTDFSQPPSNYNADLFAGIFKTISELSGLTYGATLPVDPANPTETETNDIVFRVLGDHIRTLCCSIADGILPGNEGRNYVLRRILRRAVMYGRRLNLPAGFFVKLVDPTIENLGGIFPELRNQADMIKKVISAEESAFDRTLDRGMNLFASVADKAEGAISGEDAFTLYDTYGFPLDLTEILARERGLTVDQNGFEKAMDIQRQRARDSQKKSVITVAGDGEATEFVGFDPANWSNFDSEVLEIIEQDGNRYLVTSATPFYAEMGGQVGDQGMVTWEGGESKIIDTIRDGSGRHLHKVASSMSAIAPGTAVKLTVDASRRRDIQRHHSATHILNWALRKVLGTHVLQAGSYVGPDRLRFDFNHFESVTADQQREIETLINDALIENDGVHTFETAFDDKPEEVIATFGEKYGNVVRVVDIGGFSKELCGGTHVQQIGEIGQLRLVSESSISAGVRRIEAVCAKEATQFTSREHELLQSVASALSVKANEAPDRVRELVKKLKDAEKEISNLQAEAAKNQAGDLVSQAEEINGVTFLAAAMEGVDSQGLKDAMDDLRVKLDPAVIVLGGSANGKVFFNLSVAEACQAQGAHAGKLIGPIAKVCGGGGGGKADRAQAGGKDPSKLNEAIALAKSLIAEQVG